MADVTAKQLAAMAGLDPKRMRAFVRKLAQDKSTSIIPACGQGNRYAISTSDARRIVAAYVKAHPSHKLPKAHAPKAPKAPVAPSTPEPSVTPEQDA